MERYYEVVKQVVIRLCCDKCKDVEMQPHAPAIALKPGGPQRYTHRCPKCKTMVTVDKPYPLQNIQFRELLKPDDGSKVGDVETTKDEELIEDGEAPCLN